MGISFGGGSSSGSQQAQLTPEQSELLKAQTGFLTNTAFPAYQRTIGMAGGAYNQAQPASITAANTAMDVAGQTGALQQAGGTQAYGAGLQGQQGLAGYQSGLGKGLTGQGAAGLSSLFNPQYEQGQVQAALQAGRESARESQAGQNAMYGGAGGLGSSRMALADANLSSLNAQRQGTAAAGAQAQVQANKMAAGQALLGAGQGATSQAGQLFGNLAGQGAAGLGAANQAAAARIGYGQTPQDLVSKYASVIYGTPQASTTPNFAGTQGTTGQSSSKGGGFSLSDINAKQDIRKIGLLDNGIGIYQYHYKPELRDEWGHGLQVGVIAQEVEQIIPEAVCQLSNGFKAVNYSMVLN